MIYFDNNATTKLASEVLTKMNEVYQLPLNSAATHQMGRLATKFVEEARKELRNLLNAKNYEVIFTSGATESTNTILHGCGCDTILRGAIEHASLASFKAQDKEIIEIATLENGLINFADLEEKIAGKKNFLLCLMLANNETGAIQDVFKAAKIAHQNGGLIFCDIVQAVGKIPVDLEALNVDFAVISAHKINGPQGVGALLFRKGLDVKPLIVGGKQEKSKRAGTVNVAGIAGFGVACRLAGEKILRFFEIEKLRNFLESELKKLGGEDVKIFSQDVARLPNTSFFALRNRDAQTQLIHFDINQICVSAGSACSSGSVAGSRILKAMNVPSAFLDSAIRISLAPENTREEVEKFLKVWNEFYQRNNTNA